MKILKILLVFCLFSVLLNNCGGDDNKKVEICNNGKDDDNDGFIDENDLDCTETANECNNGKDDDGDGFIDDADLDCTETASECNNGIDDDGDGFIDDADLDCQ